MPAARRLPPARPSRRGGGEPGGRRAASGAGPRRPRPARGSAEGTGLTALRGEPSPAPPSPGSCAPAAAPLRGVREGCVPSSSARPAGRSQPAAASAGPGARPPPVPAAADHPRGVSPTRAVAVLPPTSPSAGRPTPQAFPSPHLGLAPVSLWGPRWYPGCGRGPAIPAKPLASTEKHRRRKVWASAEFEKRRWKGTASRVCAALCARHEFRCLHTYLACFECLLRVFRIFFLRGGGRTKARSCHVAE